VLVLPALLLAQAPEPLRTAGDRPIDIKHLRLEMLVDLPKKSVDAKATLTFATQRALSSFALDAVDFEVLEAKLSHEGKPVDIRRHHDGKQLLIELPDRWPADKSGELTVTYRVREPKEGLHFFGPSASEPNVPLTVWSQGEPVSNRHWIPCLDHPDERQTTELIVTVADGFEVLSNGKLLSRKSNDDKSVTFHWKQEQPHPSYLVTLVVGPFAVVKEDWRGKEVSYYVPPHRKDDVARTFGRTRAMLDLFSRRFGVDYPWEKYAQVVVEQFSWGGMENTSATTLHDYALHDARAMLDGDPDGLIAHELGHQWWGDLITARDWAHLWLNEGWASYCEIIWSEHHRSRADADYDLIHKARGALGGAKDRPVVDRRYPNPITMFDARAYPKGAWILHMLRHQLGEEMFWKCVQTYAKEHKYRSVETSDFRRTFERVAGRSLERFFHDWTERAGNPILEVRSEFQSDSKLLKVHVKQLQPGEAFQLDVPVRYALYNPSSPSDWQNDVLPVREKDQVLYVRTGAMPVDFHIDPQLTLLAEWQLHQPRDWWVRQMEAESVALRIRAAGYFGKSKSPQDREVLVAALRKEKFWGVAVEIAAALGDSGGDICRGALIEGLSRDDPKIRKACAEQLSKFGDDATVVAAIKSILQKGDASYFVEAAALTTYGKLRQKDAVSVLLPWLAKDSYQEVLRGSALEGLGRSQDIGVLDALVTWTQRGKPAPARIGALGALAQLAKTANPNDAQRKQIADAIGACLNGESLRVRRAAADAIRDLGRSAAPSADVLEMLSRHDSDPGIADLARKALDKIRADTPAPVELTRLREELEKIKRENASLKERLERVERK
jgi:aminopeptidase N